MAWAKIANIKGPKGDPGPQAVSADVDHINAARLGTDHKIMVDSPFAVKTVQPITNPKFSWNSADKPGLHPYLMSSDQTTDGPPNAYGSYFYCWTLEYAGQNVTQLAVPYSLPGGFLAIRTRETGSWSAWKYVSSFTQTDADARYALKSAIPSVAGFLTQTAADARYALKTAIPSLTAYITTAAADAKYALKTQLPNMALYLLKTEAATLYEPKVKIVKNNGEATSAAHSLPDETIVMVVP